MNAYSAFANSPRAGYLVASLTLLGVAALLVGIWTIERWIKSQRDARAWALKTQRRQLRESRLAETAGPTGNHARVLAGRFRTRVAESEADRRLKAIGVDDGFHQWAERNR